MAGEMNVTHKSWFTDQPLDVKIKANGNSFLRNIILDAGANKVDIDVYVIYDGVSFLVETNNTLASYLFPNVNSTPTPIALEAGASVRIVTANPTGSYSLCVVLTEF